VVQHSYQNLQVNMFVFLCALSTSILHNTVYDHSFVPRLPWRAPCSRWNFLRDTGGVHRIHT